MKCIFSRHGESQANIQNIFSNTGYTYGLTQQGRTQARELAEKVRNHYDHIKKMYCSPLKRAVETATIVQETLKVELEHDHRLIEFYVGELEGRSDPESWEVFHQVWNAWTVEGNYAEVIPGGERFVDIIKRMTEFLEEREHQYAHDDEILCISHGGVLKTALPYITGEKNYFNERYIDHTEIIELHTYNGTYEMYGLDTDISWFTERHIPENHTRTHTTGGDK